MNLVLDGLVEGLTIVNGFGAGGVAPPLVPFLRLDPTATVSQTLVLNQPQLDPLSTVTSSPNP